VVNGLYWKARQALLEGQFNLLADTVKLTLLHFGYRPDYQAHQWLSDIGEDYRQVPALTLTGKTCTDGVFNAAPVTFTGVHDGLLGGDGMLPGVVGGLLLYIDKGTGDAASTPLLACLQLVAQGLPLFVGTRDITVDWSPSLNRIFRL